MTIIMKTDPEYPSMESIQAAANIIREGGLVVFPTETVYGLGANAFSPDACMRIFEAKERPPDNPLIVHISNFDMLENVVKKVPDALLEKLRLVWPGPVTILFPKSDHIPDEATGGSALVAVRMPDNRLALELIEQSGVPIAAPSANISTRPSITDSRHAIEELEGRVDLIMDCGLTSQGLESTIIDVSGETVTLLRAGAKSVEDLEKIFGPIKITDFARGLIESSVPLAPGMKYRHYSPRSRLYLVSSAKILQDASCLPDLVGRVVIIGSDETCGKSCSDCIKLGPEADMDTIARNLFSALRELDSLEGKVGLIQGFPENGKGLAIMNRIRKASSGNADTLEDLRKLLL